MPANLLKPILACDPQYLSDALDQLDAEYGSVPEYLRVRLNIDAPALTRIRSRLLEH